MSEKIINQSRLHDGDLLGKTLEDDSKYSVLSIPMSFGRNAMSDQMDKLITKHYCAHVLGQLPVEEVIAEMRDSFSDAALREEAMARLDQLEHHISVRGGDLSQHDFCGHIEHIGLTKALKQE